MRRCSFTKVKIYADKHSSTGGLRPTKKIFLLPSKGRAAKNLYTKLERITVGCRVPLGWSEGLICTMG
jgi:hypothetical protein